MNHKKELLRGRTDYTLERELVPRGILDARLRLWRQLRPCGSFEASSGIPGAKLSAPS